MNIVDFILNLAGLLMWLNWRAVRFDPLEKRTPATLLGTLRPATPSRRRRWHLLAGLGGLLVLRAVLYWKMGSSANWVGKLDLGAIALSFPSNLAGPVLSFWRMMLFSLLSFGRTLGVVYLWLLLLSLLAGPEPLHRLVRMQLGRIDRWPRWVKGLLPLVGGASAWWLASWALTGLQVLPRPVSAAHRLEEAGVIGLESYLVWPYAAVLLLALQLLNCFVYFGDHPVWNYVEATGRALLAPLRWGFSAVGRAWPALGPRPSGPAPRRRPGWSGGRVAATFLLNVLGMALVCVAAELAERGLEAAYAALPL